MLPTDVYLIKPKEIAVEWAIPLSHPKGGYGVH